MIVKCLLDRAIVTTGAKIGLANTKNRVLVACTFDYNLHDQNQLFSAAFTFVFDD